METTQLEEMVLTVENLSKRFGRGAAVENVSFHLKKGEVISLLGPSGCGKTTTLRCIAGFYQLDEGTITIGGKLVASRTVFMPPEDRQLAMVFQNYVLWPHMRVFDNIAYGLKLRSTPRREIENRVAEMTDLLGLAGLEQRFPHQLSGGQQQRVSVARSLIVRPAVLLLDEPFSNLDAKLRVQMRQEMRDLLQRLGISAVYVTHDQEEAMVLSDRILLMNAGVLVEEGSPARLFEKPTTIFAANFFGIVNMLPGTLALEDGKFFLRLDDLEAAIELPTNLKGEHGKRYVLGLRENAFVVEQGEANSLPWINGQIQGRYYVGGAIGLEVRCRSNRLIRCRVGSAAMNWNETVSMRIVPEGAVLLPEHSRDTSWQ